MQEQEKVVNQTLLIWAGVVIVEVFVIAHLMLFPWLILAAATMFWPLRAALNWPAPVITASDNPKDTTSS